MSYNWLKYVVYKSVGGEKEARFIIPENQSAANNKDSIVPMDYLILKLQKESPNATAYELHYPKTPNESIYV